MKPSETTSTGSPQRPHDRLDAIAPPQVPPANLPDVYTAREIADLSPGKAIQHQNAQLLQHQLDVSREHRQLLQSQSAELSRLRAVEVEATKTATQRRTMKWIALATTICAAIGGALISIFACKDDPTWFAVGVCLIIISCVVQTLAVLFE